MKIAILSPLTWRTPPKQYGPWEQVASQLCEGLINAGVEVTLFASGNSITSGKLESVSPVPYGENSEMDPKVWECLHIGHFMEQAFRFDIVHNHYDFLPLTYSRLISTPMVTTIHGFSSPKILEVYCRYNADNHYVAISKSDRSPRLDYAAVIHHGIDSRLFNFSPAPTSNHLLYLGRIHPEKGAVEAIAIAKKTSRKLVIAGLIQDQAYFKEKVAPEIDGEQIVYVGNVGPIERNRLLGEAEGMLHPISFAEPFGLSVVESFFCGTPVIAFNRGSMPELIENGANGFLTNSVEEAAESVSDLKSLDRKNCRKIADERFSLSRMIKDYLELYGKVLNEIKK